MRKPIGKLLIGKEFVPFIINSFVLKFGRRRRRCRSRRRRRRRRLL